jgi:hypothetical protein
MRLAAVIVLTAGVLLGQDNPDITKGKKLLEGRDYAGARASCEAARADAVKKIQAGAAGADEQVTSAVACLNKVDGAEAVRLIRAAGASQMERGRALCKGLGENDPAAKDCQAALVVADQGAKKADAAEALRLIRSGKPDELERGRTLCNGFGANEPFAKDCQTALTDRDLHAKELDQLDVLEASVWAGRRADVTAQIVTTLRDSKNSDVRERAPNLIRDANGLPAMFLEQIHSPWLVAFLWVGGLLLLLWAVLRLAKRIYHSELMERWRHGHPVRWTLLPIQESPGTPPSGAGESVLDALGRAPADARRQPSLMRNLLLRPIDFPDYDVDVWRDFLPAPDFRLPQFDEGLKALSLFEGKAADDALFDALQNVQVLVGGIGVNVVGRTLRAVGDWWRSGGPALSGGATITNTDVGMRLTCSGGPTGHVTVLASTVKEPGVDCVALTAERVAFKLLYRLARPHVPVNEVDGAAAYRQCVAMLDRALTPFAESDKDARRALLKKTADGFQFARQALSAKSSVGLLSARHEGLVQSLLGNRGLALELFEMLEDRSEGLAREARYNQAVLHFRDPAASPLELRVAAQIAGGLLASPVDPPDGIQLAAAVVLLSALAGLPRAAWVQLDNSQTEAWIKAARATAESMGSVDSWPPSDRRRWQYLVREARRAYAVATVKRVSTLCLPGRRHFAVVPFDPQSISSTLADPVKVAVDFLVAYLRIAVAVPDVLLALAYGHVLAGNFDVAEALIADVAHDGKNEYACYLAAEALFCQGKRDEAKATLGRFQGTPAEAAFLELRAALA